MKQLKWSLYSVELGEEFGSDSLIKIYSEQKRLKADDKEHHIKRTYYVTKNEYSGSTVYETEGRVYKRGSKVYFK